LRKRAKRHDYFTSALPWPQKGPSVEIGLTGNAPITGFGKDSNWEFSAKSGSNVFWELQAPLGIRNSPSLSTGTFTPLGSSQSTLTFEGSSVLQGLSGDSFSFQKGVLTHKSGPDLTADLSGVSAITINDLRQAFQIQKFYEKWARGGSRYTETLRVMFNVISPDARLQRPEYLGGTHSRVNVVPTAQTSSTDSVSPQSNLSAFGVLGDSAHGFNKSFVEHGYVIGLVCLRADITYQQGLNRMWSRRQLFDFYWPTLAHLGEQVVYNKEIYTQGTADDKGVFGYQERYAEYRYKPSMITGKLRSTDPQTLDVWHLAQKFDTLPKLNQDFIEENPPINRVIAVQNEPQFFADFWFDLKTSRPMPVYSVPGLVDHF
jgi:hypothetical protein